MSKRESELAPVEENALTEETEQHIQLLLQRVIDGGPDFTPTEKQVDEILAQRKTIYSYVHEERMQEHEEFKISKQAERFNLSVILIFMTIISAAVLWRKPEYFNQVLTGLLAFGGGYGIGRGSQRPTKPDSPA